MKKITIIIPLHNSEKYIDKCLTSLGLQSFKDFKIILFDNQDKHHKNNIKKYKKTLDIEYISSEKNIGWTGSNNRCLRMVDTEYSFLLNIDTHLERHCLSLLYEFSKKQKDAVLISPEILEYEDFNYEREGSPLSFNIDTGLINGYKLLDDFIEVNFVPGTAMLINMKKIPLDELYFDDSFFMYHEDVDFSIRMVIKQYGKLLFVKGPKVAHASKQSFDRVQTCWYAVRNCLRCLSGYQGKSNYIKKIPSYIFTYLKFYINFYYKYYPLAYPFISIFHIFNSVFTCSKDGNIEEFQNIHKDMRKNHELMFSFIF